MKNDSRARSTTTPNLALRFDRLYCFSYDLPTDGPLRALFRNEQRIESLVTGESQPEKPVLIDVRGRGKRLFDFLSEYNSNALFVSPRVIEVLTAASISGWSTYPVEIHWKSGVVHDYRGLAFQGRCGATVQLKNPEVHYNPDPPEVPFTAWIRYYFDPATWSGDDLFLSEDNHRCFTQNVKQAIESAKLTNFHFLPLAER